MILITGSSHKPLAEKIAKNLNVSLHENGRTKFADQEIFVEIPVNVRGHDVFIIQSTSRPANDTFMELMITIDALRRASPRRITAVIPYFGYARQDRKTTTRSPITAKLIANLLQSAGADRILTLELHSHQIQGFFDIPVDNLFASRLFAESITLPHDAKDLRIVSPDVGGLIRARAVAKRLNAEVVVIDKRRDATGKSQVMNVIGDVCDKTCILVDDIVDSGGTLVNAARALKEKQAKDVMAYCVHAVLSNDAVNRIQDSPIDQMVVTDSIDLSDEIVNCPNLSVLSIAPLLSECIKRISEERSLSELFL